MPVARSPSPDARDRRLPELPAGIALAAAAGALLAVLPGVIWSLFATGMARPVELGWLWFLGRTLEEWNLEHVSRASYLRMPFDLTLPADLLRFLSVAFLGNSLLASAVVVIVLWPLSRVPGIARSPTLRQAGLPACAVALAAAPESLRVLVPVFYRYLFPEVRWILTTGFLLAATLAVAAFVGLLAFVLLRATGRRGRSPRWRWSRRFAALSLIVAAGCLLLLQPPSPRPPDTSSPKPNLLLISIDSLRADHLHCYGYSRQTSPNIDALAREGTRFETAVAPTSWTLPSHITLLTGLPPGSHGVIFDRTRLTPDALTLAEVLRESGYRTVALVSAPYLDASYGYYQGFEYYDDFTVRTTYGGRKSADAAAELWVTSELLARETKRTLRDWQRRREKRPLFLFLHMWDVHYDYIPPSPYDSIFDDSYEGTITGDFDEVTADLQPRDLERVVSLYDGEIRFVDELIGRILSFFRDLRMLDETVVVVTADHGEEFFEHGRAGHRNNLYDESLLVPLVFRYPRKVPADRVVAAQARLMDVGPTVLSLLGVDKPAAFAAVEGAQDEIPTDLTRYFEGPRSSQLRTAAFGDLHGTVASLRTGEFKLISYLDGTGSDELYRLRDDRGEKVNVIAEEPEIGSRLRTKLGRWRSRQGIASFAKKISISEEHERKLRALGYLE